MHDKTFTLIRSL